MKHLFIILIICLLVSVSCGQLPSQFIVPELLPVITIFEASPSVIKPGEVSNLRWKVTGTSTVSIDNGIGNVAVSGTIPVTPGISTYFTLTARNSAGESTARTQIIVTLLSQPAAGPVTPVIKSFMASRDIIVLGEPVELSWDISEATQVVLSEIGKVNLKDKTTIYPAATTTYVLTASNSYGTSSQSITVLVQSPQSSHIPSQQLLKLPVLSEESGSLTKSSSSYTLQKGICAGDTAGNLAQKAFLSFDISTIPETAIIQEAILDLSNYTKSGNPTYAVSMWGNMGAIEVYHYQYGAQNDLASLAYNRAAKLTENGRFITYPLSLWVLDVKNSIDGEQVLQGLVQNHQTRLQLRIQFFTSTNWNSESDAFCFDNASITIKYVIP